MKNNVASSQTVLLAYGRWVVLGVFLHFYLRLFKHALIDDAFITLRYAKTLLASGTWGFFPGQIANSATSPLNVLLLTIVSLFTGPTVEAALWLYFICMFCAALLLVHLSLQVTGSEMHGWLAVFALVFNPLLISTIGIESMVFAALFVFGLYCYHIKKWTTLALVLGLLTLTRAEGGLFFLVFLLFVPGMRTKLHITAVYFLCIIPWYLFSWIHLGSFLPDTFFIKMEENWRQWDFFNGITTLYYYAYRSATILAFIFLPLALFLINKKVRGVTILLICSLAGLIHFLAYSFLMVPPFHWYYAPEIIAIIVLGSIGLGTVYRFSNSVWQRRALSLLTLIYFLVPALGMLYLLGRDNFVVREMPIHSNWATHEQYREIGLWLKANHETDAIRLERGEIGTLAYYCDCRLLDWFSERTWLKDYIARHSKSPVESALLKINFAFYSNPAPPACAYALSAYSTGPSADVKVIKEWEISTGWVSHAIVVLSQQE